MIAKAARTLKSGAEFDHLFPRSKGDYIRRKADADTGDTLRLIQQVVRRTRSQTARLAPELQGGNLVETCRNIWQFVYEHIQYKKDTPGHEEIRQPVRSWADRKTGVDCDCYTVFISSILTNLRIPHVLRVTDYGKGWQHIYVVVPKDGNPHDLDQTQRSQYITIDDVTDHFDYEVKYTKKRDVSMTLNELNGLPMAGLPQAGLPNYMQGKSPMQGLPNYMVGKSPLAGPLAGKAARARAVVGENSLKQRKTKIGKFLQKASRTVMKVNPATVLLRNGVLAAMKLNFKGLARKLRFAYSTPDVAAKYGYSAEKYAKLRDQLIRLQNTFVKAGGEAANLKKAILGGKGNRDHAIGGFYGLDGELGEVLTLAAITAAMAALTPLIQALKGVQPDPSSAEYEEVLIDEEAEVTDEEGVEGYGYLGATKAERQQKRAAKRLQTALTKESKGKKLTKKQQEVLTKAKAVNAALMPGAVLTAQPTKAQLKKENRVVKRKAIKDVKAAAKATGQSGKEKRQAVKAVRQNARVAKQQIKKGNTAQAKAIQAQNAQIVRQVATQIKTGQEVISPVVTDEPLILDTTATSSNPGIVVPEVVETQVPTATPIPVPKVRRLPKLLKKAGNVLQTATKVVQAADSAYTKVSSANTPPIVEADVVDTAYEDVTTMPDEAVAASESTPKPNYGLMAGIGVGALLLGSMLFGGGKSSGSSKRDSDGLDGVPNRRGKKKATTRRKKKAYTANRSRQYAGVPLS